MAAYLFPGKPAPPRPEVYDARLVMPAAAFTWYIYSERRTAGLWSLLINFTKYKVSPKNKTKQSRFGKCILPGAGGWLVLPASPLPPGNVVFAT